MSLYNCGKNLPHINNNGIHGTTLTLGDSIFMKKKNEFIKGFVINKNNFIPYREFNCYGRIRLVLTEKTLKVWKH